MYRAIINQLKSHFQKLKFCISIIQSYQQNKCHDILDSSLIKEQNKIQFVVQIPSINTTNKNTFNNNINPATHSDAYQHALHAYAAQLFVISYLRSNEAQSAIYILMMMVMASHGETNDYPLCERKSKKQLRNCEIRSTLCCCFYSHLFQDNFNK